MPVSISTSQDAERLLEFIAWLGYTPRSQPGTGVLLALQGCTPNGAGGLDPNDNATDLYNDTIVLIESLSDGTTRATAWLGTTDPGRQKPGASVPAAGLAHITWGMHEYVKGNHPRVGGRPALRARNEENRVWRDKAQDGKFTDGDIVDEGSFGVNIHAGGRQVGRVGDYSQGCINVYGGPPDPWNSPSWTSFIGAVYQYLPSGASFIEVCVWRFRDLEKWLADPTGHRPLLIPGVKGPWVTKVQKRLNAHGYSLLEDGDWMTGTTKAIRDFQLKKGLTVDYLCGPNTWKALDKAP